MNDEKDSKVFSNLLFPKICQTFLMVIHPGKLIIAFMALTVICLTGWIMDFSKTAVIVENKQGEVVSTELGVYIANPDRIDNYLEEYGPKTRTEGINSQQIPQRKGVFFLLWRFSAERFNEAVHDFFAFNLPGVAVNIAAYFKAARWVLTYHSVYCVIFFIIMFAVIALAGGAICRITALQFARGEKPGIVEALRYSKKKFWSFFAAPLFPTVLLVLAGLCVSLLGLIGRIPGGVGQVIMALTAPLILLAGVAIALLFMGTVAGFNLMYPAVAYDGSDFLDAFSRSFHYIFRRPWRMGFYSTIGVAYGAVCYIFVRLFVFLLILSSRWFLQIGYQSSDEPNKLSAIWPEPSFMNLRGTSQLAEISGAESFASVVILLSLLVVLGLLVSFIISYYFSTNTIIYSLMRNKVEDIALEEIYTHTDSINAEPLVPESEEPL